jgi:YidC/Oxa1 family membrane protein insertase
MDKKSIIGFVIIMALILLWTPLWNFFMPPKPVPPRTVADSTSVNQIKPDNLSKSNSLSTQDTLAARGFLSDSLSLTQAQNEPEKLLTIDTRNLRVTLSTYGGNVKQVVLKNYLRYDADQVSLLGDNSSLDWGRFGALTVGYTDKILPFNGQSFQVDSDSTILNRQDSVKSVTFTYTSPNGGTIVKKYTFHYQDYLFNLSLDIKQPDKLGLAQGITVGWFAPPEPTELDIVQDKTKLGGFFDMGGEYDYFNKLKGTSLRQIVSGPVDWIATRTKYFASIVIADSTAGDEVVVVGNQITRIAPNGKSVPWEQYGVGMTYNNPGNENSLSFRVYTGPLDYDKLQKMGGNLSRLLEFGWKLFRPFAIAILWLFTNLHKMIPNYGFVIIVFSIIMKVIFWPLSLKSAKAMYKMKEIQPKLSEIKEKFKNDPAKLNSETMKAYKEYGVNPFGSCLPMLIQLPIFWALYAVLSNTIELRGANFIFWIHDLSQPDPSGKIIPFGIGVLPIIMGIAMFFQQKMTITDPKQKMMIYMMPALFTFLFSRWASGLVLYWTMFSLIGIFEQWMVQRHIAAEKAEKQYM